MIHKKSSSMFLKTIEDTLRQRTSIDQIFVVSIFDDSRSIAVPAVVMKLPKPSHLSEIKIVEITDEICEENKLSGGVFFVEEIPVSSDGHFDREKIQDLVNSFHKDHIKNFRKKPFQILN